MKFSTNHLEIRYSQNAQKLFLTFSIFQNMMAFLSKVKYCHLSDINQINTININKSDKVINDVNR